MEIIYIALLFFTFVAGESRNLKFASYSLIPQGLLIAISVYLLAYMRNISSFYLIASLDILVRAILMPTVLIILLKSRLEKEDKPTITHPLSIALSIVVLSVGYNFMDTIRITSFPNVLSCFTAGFTLFIYGLFLLLSKRDMVKMIISFFIIENGIHFLIISMLPNMPKTIEIGLTFNFIIAILFFIYITMKLNILSIMEQVKKFKIDNNAFNFEENKE